MITESDVLTTLRSVRDPELDHNIVELGIVREIEVDGGHVWVQVQPTSPACPFGKELKKRVEDAVAAMSGVSSVEVEWA